MSDMKRFILWVSLVAWAFFSLVFPVNAQQCSEDQYASNTIIIKKKAVAVSAGGGGCGDANCPSGTYQSRWDGDYSGDTDQICYNSCASSKDGSITGTVTIDGSCGEAGNGVCLTDPNEGLYWDISSDDILTSNVGTICFSMYLDVEAYTNVTGLFELHNGSTADAVVVNTYTGGTIRAINYAGATTGTVTTPTAFATRTWVTIKYTWDGPNGDHKICHDASCDEDLDEISAPAAAYTKLIFGEDLSGNTMADDVRIDKVRIYSTYDAACGS